MIYLPKLFTKVCLIILCGLISLHIIFILTKSYTVHYQTNDSETSNINIDKANEMQYQIILSSLYDKIHIINSTTIKYLFIFPEISILFIYLGYFLIVISVILSAKFIKNE
ncbi:MAG: hypothetical protein WCO13_12380 [Bacteroidota bacterium]